ncbi:uncharacterized protein LOC143083400 [Mytilus galloprovincialis]|uniref:CRP-I 9 n=1 Tax=Mytilus galloprovincialis TaxID=29158 RepID=A0A0A7AD04_MYTGA|nr:CRP-I 9 [Mytilus galloprovincialis]
MKVFVCLVACMLLMSVGVSMANDEMMEDNELTHDRVKRAPCYNRRCVTSYQCCSGYRCSYRRCVRRKG